MYNLKSFCSHQFSKEVVFVLEVVFWLSRNTVICIVKLEMSPLTITASSSYAWYLNAILRFLQVSKHMADFCKNTIIECPWACFGCEYKVVSVNVI